MPTLLCFAAVRPVTSAATASCSSVWKRQCSPSEPPFALQIHPPLLHVPFRRETKSEPLSVLICVSANTQRDDILFSVAVVHPQRQKHQVLRSISKRSAAFHTEQFRWQLVRSCSLHRHTVVKMPHVQVTNYTSLFMYVSFQEEETAKLSGPLKRCSVTNPHLLTLHEVCTDIDTYTEWQICITQMLRTVFCARAGFGLCVTNSDLGEGFQLPSVTESRNCQELLSVPLHAHM